MTHQTHTVRRDWGVALSGGGVRAGAFALGGLLYLVDSGLNRRVSVVSSVSGASLTNGFLLSRVEDFSEVDAMAFDEVVQGLVRRLVLKPLMGRAILLLNILLLTAGVLVFGASLLAWPGQLTLWIRIALPFMWGIAFLLRGVPIEFLINRNYLDADAWHGRRLTLGRSRPAGATAHVFCSTDFVTRSPFFLVDYGDVGCAHTAFGWALADDVSVATAVRASAAMPGAFPPRALSSRKLRFMDETEATTVKPRWFHLADGGVWDNLGTQWFDRMTGPREEEWESVATNCQVAPPEAPPASHSIRKLLVLDARGWGVQSTGRQARSRSMLFRIPLISELLMLSGTLSLLYANTVEPRVKGFMDLLRTRMAQGTSGDPTLVSVGTLTDYPFDRGGSEAWNVLPQAVRDALYSKDPASWIDAPCVQRLPDHLRALVDLSAQFEIGAKALATPLPEWLARECKDFPAEIGNLWQRCSDIGTKLSALSAWEVIALLVHGYVQAMGAAAALIAAERCAPGPLPISFPGIERFSRLL